MSTPLATQRSQPVDKAVRVAITSGLIITRLCIGFASANLIDGGYIDVKIFRNAELGFTHSVAKTNFINLRIAQEPSTTPSFDWI